MTLFGLFGGLAIFIFGMNLMSEGLQKAAGDRLKSILEVLTKNPLIGVLVGVLVTSVLQSSSATTVMMVGFVSAGLMSLRQSLSVILGANIGTTITSQLVAFNVGEYALPITAIGFILFFFSKGKAKHFGQTIFAFGLLFVGINTMSAVLKPLAQLPEFAELLLNVKDVPILGVLVGTVSTMIIQSSSAVIAVIQSIATQAGPDGVGSVMSLQAAIALLLGSNIGTTITALLASIGASRNAKRAAVAHTLFNLCGVVLLFFFIPPYANLIQAISAQGPELEVISRQIANSHTLFNVLNALVWLPFLWLMEKIVRKVVRGQDIPSLNEPKFLDDKVLHTPAIAMELAARELSDIIELTKDMLFSSEKAFLEEDEKEIQRILDNENLVDSLQRATVNYLSAMLASSDLNERQSKKLAGMLHTASDIERIGDHCENIAGYAQLKKDKGLKFSEEAIKEITTAFSALKHMMCETIFAMNKNDPECALRVLEREHEVNNLENRLRESHMLRLNARKCSPESAITYIELIHNLEKIGDHCTNIAETVLKQKSVSYQKA
ncbi:MAG: Na/Pi cotransporter family protein [Christensenellales bacterium]